MTGEILSKVARELNIPLHQVRAVAGLLDEGATVPFISRYRKEMTGSLDEVAVLNIRDQLTRIAELDKRREAILESLKERNLLTDDLLKNLGAAETMTSLEDIYLPFRPKKRTRATIAREKGLEPLANRLLSQPSGLDPLAAAREFINAEKGVETPEDALTGAGDIIAEVAGEDSEIRREMRLLFIQEGLLSSKVVKNKEEDGSKFRDYFDWQEPASKSPGHRLLAIFRGENEGFLKISISPPEDKALRLLFRRYVKGNGPCADRVAMALEDGFKRLLAPSMENETRAALKAKADDEAIMVFSKNLRELLMAPSLGQKPIVAIDPGFRTGCKTVCLDPQGKLLHNTVIFPTGSELQIAEAGKALLDLHKKFQFEAVAIGNGTGSRETENFVRQIPFSNPVPVIVVNESGASIYSASEVAREEFPDHDITVRGAVSIGRRLMDPLAELVKIDPKSIGVGQYQHDVDQTKLKTSLDDIVTSCVNAVGVEINTASRQLLTYVSGLGPQLAKNIVTFRDENGPFKNRSALKKVPRLGPKAFEQAAGFLRIRESSNPLDASAVHPESYSIVDRMAKDLSCQVKDLIRKEDLRKTIILERYQTEKVGLPTLRDILQELAKPGRDPREKFEVFSFAEDVQKLEDLKPGRKLPGIVTNVTKFGAFVDIGVHQDGLVHISELADKFVKDPNDFVKVQQKVQVTVLEVDCKRRRISLSMKTTPGSVKKSNSA